MEFRLAFTPTKFPFQVTHHNRVMLIGSCFTENIGEKLLLHKFPVMQNPNGILFNPVSVADAITHYENNRQITEADLFFLNESWHSWQHHSRFSGISAEESITNINESTTAAHKFLKMSDFIVITYGSAWVYERTSEAAGEGKGLVAANNHKAPANWFNRRLLTQDETTLAVSNAIQSLKRINKHITILFTISPVRHIREGFVENNRSKARLIDAVHEACEQYNQVYYFPAYELVIDDLRDYRFFAEDMVHPNYQATQYVWEKFVQAAMNDDTRMLMEQINEINAALQHRPFNSGSNAHAAFKEKYLAKTQALAKRNPALDFGRELQYFSV